MLNHLAPMAAFAIGLTVGALALGATLLSAPAPLRYLFGIAYVGSALFAAGALFIDFVGSLFVRSDGESARLSSYSARWLMYLAGCLIAPAAYAIMLAISVLVGGLA